MYIIIGNIAKGLMSRLSSHPQKGPILRRSMRLPNTDKIWVIRWAGLDWGPRKIFEVILCNLRLKKFFSLFKILHIYILRWLKLAFIGIFLKALNDFFWRISSLVSFITWRQYVLILGSCRLFYLNKFYNIYSLAVSCVGVTRQKEQSCETLHIFSQD